MLHVELIADVPVPWLLLLLPSLLPSFEPTPWLPSLLPWSEAPSLEPVCLLVRATVVENASPSFGDELPCPWSKPLPSFEPLPSLLLASPPEPARLPELPGPPLEFEPEPRFPPLLPSLLPGCTASVSALDALRAATAVLEVDMGAAFAGTARALKVDRPLETPSSPLVPEAHAVAEEQFEVLAPGRCN